MEWELRSLDRSNPNWSHKIYEASGKPGLFKSILQEKQADTPTVVFLVYGTAFVELAEAVEEWSRAGRRVSWVPTSLNDRVRLSIGSWRAFIERSRNK